jgi:hypothetical protein
MPLSIRAPAFRLPMRNGSSRCSVPVALLRPPFEHCNPGAVSTPARFRFDEQGHEGDGAMKELIKFIAQELVDFPDQVSVDEIEGNQTSVIELKVAKEDLGKVIGKQGRTARAMRTLLSAASAKIKKRTVLEIIE